MSKTNLLLDAHPLSIACTTPTADSPIGVFDSGVGGLSVYQHLRQQLPYERYLYYADTKHVPYGSRTAEDISNLALTGIDWLIRQGCKLVVVACNSASAHALNQARLRYPTIPIVGLVPALKPALAYVQAKNAQLTQASANLSNHLLSNHLGNHVAVLATMATLHGQPLNDVMVQFATPHAIRVSKWYEPALVPWVERGMPPTDATAERLRKMLMLFAKQGVQAIVLGCTHYPFFKEFLLNQMVVQGHDMALFDSGDAIARRVKQLLAEQGLLMSPKNMPQKNTLAVSNCLGNQHSKPNPHQLQFFATAMTQGLSELVMKLCDEEVMVDKIDG